MTVNSQANTTTVLGTGSQTQFTFPFIGVAAAYMSVIFTDASGNETVLQQGAGSSQCQIVLNAPVAGAVWGLGGTVTYNPGGAPIAVGTTLTIFRTLPLTQAISLQNMISLATLGNGAETGLDTLEMQIQQVAELQGRAIVAPIVDPSTINLTLPAAAQRANTGLAFDSQGNVIASTTPATGLISSAMQPVVDAASLALGRTAFGLGGMAVEGIGAGLQDDGSGNARVFYGTVSDVANQTVTAAFHLTQRIASASSLSVPLIYSLPRANTLFNGFGFWVFALSGNATLTPNANDNFDGLATGVSVAVPQGTWVWVTTNAASSGTWHIQYNNENVAIQATVTGNTLVVTVNATALRFRDPTLTSGDQLWQNIPANLTITVPNGASLGSPGSSTPFRIWLFLHRNGGTPVLGVVLASAVSGNSVTIFPVSSWEVESIGATAISAGSTTAGILYTAGSVTSDVVRMLGYIGFGSGQASAGVWATAPTKVQNLSPGMKRPGDTVQVAQASPTVSITPHSKENPIRLTGTAYNTSLVNALGQVQFTRGGTPIGLVQIGGAVTSASDMPVGMQMIDAPNSNSSLSYGLANVNGSTGILANILMIAEELMG